MVFALWRVRIAISGDPVHIGQGYRKLQSRLGYRSAVPETSGHARDIQRHARQQCELGFRQPALKPARLSSGRPV